MNDREEQKLEMHVSRLRPICSPPGANAPAKRRGYSIKVHRIFFRCRVAISSALVLWLKTRTVKLANIMAYLPWSS